MIGSGRLDANIADAITVWGSDLCSGRMYNLDLTWVGVALTLILTCSDHSNCTIWLFWIQGDSLLFSRERELGEFDTNYSL